MQADVWQVEASRLIPRETGQLGLPLCKWVSLWGEMGEVSSQKQRTSDRLQEGRALGKVYS